MKILAGFGEIFSRTLYARMLIKQVLLPLIFSYSLSAQEKLVGYVNPFIGTDGHGHTYPGVSLPFGMVQLSPDTDTEGWDWCSGYHYSDSSIMGFSHTHLSGTGIGDYGDILFMPAAGELKTGPGSKENPGSGYRSRFSHKNESAHPGYYSVFLDDYKIKAELTASLHAGFHKYTFPKTDSANVVIDLVHGIQDKVTDSEIKITDAETIEGFRRSTGWAKDQCVYFHAEFSKPFKSFGIIDGENIIKGKSGSKGKQIKSFVRFSTAADEEIFIKVGISFTNLEEAKKNLLSEIPGWNFDKIKNHAEKEWEEALSSINVEDPNNSNKTIFYTALYHALLNPNTFSDAGGSYLGMDKKIHHLKNRSMYTVFSLWDTFRAEHPLFTLIDEKRAGELVQALLSKYDESGLLPVWELASNETGTMIGYHSIPVIADAYFKGIKNFDSEKAFNAMKKSAEQNDNGLDSYKEMGYIPSDLENESVSKTLEYAYDDWCIAQMAKDLGRMDDYNNFLRRSKSYLNLFDPSTSLMRPKKNGRWMDPFDPYSVSGNYTEANAWQYSFFVPHDVNTLIRYLGGNESFISKLDELFNAGTKTTGRVQSDISGMIGQYAQGNEPSHHMAYLYNYAGAPWKTEEKVHEILTKMYTDKPDGLCGNEDCGQMSAWFIFSAMGFYPVCPGSNNYIIGEPLFNKITIRNKDRNDFTITAENLSQSNIYIQSARLNGKDYPFSYISHTDIKKGGELILEMGSKPSQWGSQSNSCPISLVDIPFVPVPFLISGERVFRDSVEVSISSIDSTAVIYFTKDNSNPIENKIIYKNPVEFNNSALLKAVCFKSNPENPGQEVYSKIMISRFNKIPEGRSIKIKSKYSHSYTGGGDLGLIDGIKGNLNFRTDAWQGYEQSDLDAVVDLGKIQKVSFIEAAFLQNTGSWIFYPSLIEYYISEDGNNFKKVYQAENPVDERNSGEGIKNFDKNLDGIETRYIRVFAKNVGICPPWHIGAGGKAWLFIDEITIK